MPLFNFTLKITGDTFTDIHFSYNNCKFWTMKKVFCAQFIIEYIRRFLIRLGTLGQVVDMIPTSSELSESYLLFLCVFLYVGTVAWHQRTYVLALQEINVINSLQEA